MSSSRRACLPTAAPAAAGCIIGPMRAYNRRVADANRPAQTPCAAPHRAMFSRRGLILGALWRARAQDVTFSTEVNLVELLVTVRDKAGRFAKDLTKDDFSLQEDGRPQTILHFSQDSSQPLKIGLLVDTSRSQIPVLEPERKASLTFLDQMLRADDSAFVMHFDIQVKLLQGFTSSRDTDLSGQRFDSWKTRPVLAGVPRKMAPGELGA
jgi:hypothetical protein